METENNNTEKTENAQNNNTNVLNSKNPNPVSEPQNVEMEFKGLKQPRIPSPIVIKIKNLTDEKFYNVKVFNPNFENENKIKYSANENPSTAYSDVLRNLEEKEVLIGHFRVIGWHDFNKYLHRQMNIQIKITDDNNDVTIAAHEHESNRNVIPCQIYFDIYQYSCNIVDVDVPFKLKKDVNLILEYLMPDAELLILLFKDTEKTV